MRGKREHKKIEREREKRERLCLGLQILGTLIIFGSLIEIAVILDFDLIAQHYTLRYEPGIGLEQWFIAGIGGFGALVGIFLIWLGKWAK